MPRRRLWLVVEPDAAGESSGVCAAAAQSGVEVVWLSVAALDQSYQPRIVRADD
jgi:hypothetical protein